MSFGFSVGDCLTAVLIIKDIVVSLSDSRPKYQELEKELSNLEQVLNVVKALPDDESQNQSLVAIKQAAIDCRSVLDRYTTRLLKYQKSLGAGQSSGVFKDAAKKIRWKLSMEQDVQSMKEHIAQHVAALNLQLGVEGLNATSVASAQIQQKQDSLLNSVDESRQRAVAVHGQMNYQTNVLQDTRSLVHGISRVVCQELVPQTQDVSASMTLMLQQNTQLLAMMSNLQLAQPSPDTRHTWFQPPIKFEDAIGNVIPFAQECDFYDLKALIISRFEPRSGRDALPGYHKILAEEFELFTSENSNLQITEANFGSVTCSKGITMAFIVRRSKCNAWCDGDWKSVPRPSELEAGFLIEVHRSLVKTKRRGDPTDHERRALWKDVHRMRDQTRGFKNVRLQFTQSKLALINHFLFSVNLRIGKPPETTVTMDGIVEIFHACERLVQVRNTITSAGGFPKFGRDCGLLWHDDPNSYRLQTYRNSS